MSRFLIALLLLVTTITAYANQLDSLKLESIQRTITNDSVQIANLQKEVIILKAAISTLKQENVKLHSQNQKQTTDFENLKMIQNQQDANVNVLATKLDKDILSANKKLDANVVSINDSIKSRSAIGMVGISVIIILLIVAYCIFKKKINIGTSSIGKIKEAQESLEVAQKAIQEDSVKMDGKLIELLERQVAIYPQTNNNVEQDHSLALKVADEIVRIETNLAHMDESVKGYKQLRKAVEHIRNNFLANGYEIVEMLGKPYNEGMKVVANFVSDEKLAEGEQKITGITKPQVNYNGKMIQAAQITVSQN